MSEGEASRQRYRGYVGKDQLHQYFRSLLSEHPEVGSLLLECSDLPPYAAELQRIVKLPVFDYITMIKFAHSAVCQKPYEGFI